MDGRYLSIHPDQSARTLYLRELQAFQQAAGNKSIVIA